MGRLLTLALLAALAGCGGSPSEPARSLVELLGTIQHGNLLERRAAIEALRGARPGSAPEMERLLAAARQTDRRRLREAARTALRNAISEPRPLASYCPSLSEDRDTELRDIGLTLCAALKSARSPLAPGATPLNVSSREWEALALAAADERTKRLFLGALQDGPDSPAAKRLLAHDGFLSAGLDAGKKLSDLGAGVLPAAAALARGGDPRRVDAGRGAVLYMKDPKAVPSLRRLASDPDPGLARAAKNALLALERKP